MPEGNVFLGEVAVVEVLAVVLAVGSSLAGFFDRRWSHRGIVATAHQPGSANVQQEASQKAVGGTEKGASPYDVKNVKNFERDGADVRRVCISAPTLGWRLAPCKLLVAMLRLRVPVKNTCRPAQARSIPLLAFSG
jgi:hypothetical protein